MRHLTLAEPAGFSQLSKTDQLEYLKSLWDRISRPPEDLPVPPSHLALAETRLAAHELEPAQTTSAYQVLDRLAARARD